MAMKPLTKETVEMTRQGLLSSEWCGFSKRDTVNQLCDLALKGLASASETGTPASDAAQRVLQLTRALEQCVRVVRQWHAMPKEPGGDDAFDLYFNHSPEMKLIRDALGNMPAPEDSGE